MFTSKAFIALKFFIKVLFLCFGISFSIVLIFLIYRKSFVNFEISASYVLTARLLTSTYTLLLTVCLVVVFYISKFIISEYKSKGLIKMIRSFFYIIIAPIIIGCLFVWTYNWARYSETYKPPVSNIYPNQSSVIKDRYILDSLQRGIHVFSLRADTSDLDVLIRHNVEWITLSPFIYQSKYNTPSIDTSTTKDSYWILVANQKKKYNLHVMVKPHIWLIDQTDGIWQADIRMANEKDWSDWFVQYKKRILEYATIAEKYGFEQFCIGTELRSPVQEKPHEWIKLIADIRSVYSGSLVYAANWNDDLFSIPLWDHLDYIGIQAYFPIADKNNPTLEDLENGWKSHIEKLEDLSTSYKRKIIFTEIGYRSASNAGRLPWEWDQLANRAFDKVSKKTQYLCYEATFNMVWGQSWFAGMHIWEWQCRGTSDGNNYDFTVESKPAMDRISIGYSALY